MLRAAVTCVLVAMGCLLGGCSAYLDGYNYFPRPALVVIPQSLQPPATQPATGAATQPVVTNEPAAMNVLATVVGVRREDSDKHLPQAVEVRLLFENGPMPAVVDPREAQLVTGGLVTLVAPTAFPAEPITLAPGQQVSVLEVFALPPGFSASNLDLSNLRLSVPMTINGRPVQAGMSFQRALTYYVYEPYPYYYPYYGPYYYARPTFYGGFYYGHGYRHR